MGAPVLRASVLPASRIAVNTVKNGEPRQDDFATRDLRVRRRAGTLKS